MGQDNQENDTYFMDLAIELAKEAELAGEVPVGAVVVQDGEVIGTGYNRPIQTTDPTAHAEMGAIREASRKIGNYRLAGCTLYVTMEPCIMCAGALIHARIARLVYACPDPKSGAAGTLYDVPGDTRLNHRVEVTTGVREIECSQLLRSFFKRRRDSSSRP